MKDEKVLFLYGKIGSKRKAMFYCNLHKCYVRKSQFFEKKFKCRNCKHSEEVKYT